MKTYNLIPKFDIQHFANVVQTTLLPALSDEMKTFYDTTLIEEAKANLVHDQFGQKRPIPANGGKRIEFRKFASLPKALTPLTEGVTPDGKSLTVTEIHADIAQYGDYITQSDVLELTAIDNTIYEATKLLGNQAGLTLDTVTRDVLVAGTNVIYADKYVSGTPTEVTQRTGLDATSVLKVENIQRAVAKLRAVNAPTFDGYYVGIIHPFVAYDLMRDPEWVDAAKYGAPEQLFAGEIGRIGGVRFVQTSEAKIFRPSSLGIFATLILAKNAYGTTEIEGGGLQTIVKQKGSAGTADPLDQRSSVGWKALKTAEVLIGQYIIRIESCSPKFSATAQAN